jgi:hypothetical protein
VSLAAQTVSIEITPQGPLRLAVAASDMATATNVGAALAKSLGCAAGGADFGEVGTGTFRMMCSGVLKRHGQVVDGQLRFAGFRQALMKRPVDEVTIDVAMHCGPYIRTGIPKSWDETCSDGVIHRRATLEPRELPTRPIRIAIGYRTLELAMIFAPLPGVVLLAVGLLAWLNRAAGKARGIDVRALWFSYVRAWSLGLTGIFVLWEAWWTGITGSLGGHLDVWALYSVWNGRSVVGGRLVATGVYVATLLYLAVLSTYWSPAVFAVLRESRRRFVAGLKTLLVPALGLIWPLLWILSAFGSLEHGQPDGFAVHLLESACFSLMLYIAIRSGRKRRTQKLQQGELRARLSALSQRCRTGMYDARVVPVVQGTIVEPLEAEGGRVALSDFVADTFEPAEIEAAVARCWSMPMHTYPWIRSVLMMLAALVAGALVSVATLVILNTPLAFLEGLLKIRLPILSGQLALPLALLCAVPAYRLAEGWMVRRADRRAAVLLGDAELVTQVAAKLAATRMAPWKWGRAADEAPAAPAAASPETAPA